MRVTTLLIGFTVAAAACDGKPLTGPDAQRAVAQASGMFARLPKDILVVVDGKRLESDERLKDIDPASIGRSRCSKARPRPRPMAMTVPAA